MSQASEPEVSKLKMFILNLGDDANPKFAAIGVASGSHLKVENVKTTIKVKINNRYPKAEIIASEESSLMFYIKNVGSVVEETPDDHGAFGDPPISFTIINTDPVTGGNMSTNYPFKVLSVSALEVDPAV